MSTTLVALVLLAGFSVGADAVAEEAQSSPLPEVQALMTGTFSSAAQAAEDESFFNIRLVMVPVWPQREDGPWLYVEQAAASALEQPYRQRVYRLVDEGAGEDGVTRVRSVVYALKGDPLEHAGAFRQESPLGALSPQDLEERAGCDILLLRQEDGTWAGETSERSCSSALRGASYATSEVEIEEGLLLSWDRGFNEAGEQVWGATEGGYRFVLEQP
ncbi:MAG: chromophore lyase CpcT/CpeT [Acidobacteriota bacterium]